MIKNFYPVYFVTGASISDGSIVLSISGSPAISEHSHFAIRFAPGVSIPSGCTADMPVVISIGSSTYAIKDKYAEPVTFAEMPKDRVNCSYFNPRFVIVGGIGSSTDSSATTYYYVAWDIPLN